MRSDIRTICRYGESLVKLYQKISFTEDKVFMYNYTVGTIRRIYNKAKIHNISDVIEDNRINGSYISTIDFDEGTALIPCLELLRKDRDCIYIQCDLFDYSVPYVIDRSINVFDNNKVVGTIRIDLALDENYKLVRYVKKYVNFKDKIYLKNKYDLDIKYKNNKINKISRTTASIMNVDN